MNDGDVAVALMIVGRLLLRLPEKQPQLELEVAKTSLKTMNDLGAETHFADVVLRVVEETINSQSKPDADPPPRQPL